MTQPDHHARRRLAAKFGSAPRPEEGGSVAPPNVLTAPSLNGGSTSTFYDSVSSALDATPLGEFSRFLNYGYVDSPEDESVTDLPIGTLDRASVKLILELVGGVDLRGLRVIDVGAGRGGTASTLLKYCAPRSVLGVELSPAAVASSRRSIVDPRASFVVGDAQDLPVTDAGADVLTNVESSHCYPDVRRFYSEVERVLTPGGTFLYTDILAADSLGWRREHLRARNLHLYAERDITAQVLAACDLIAERRQASFAGAVDDSLRDFLCVPGSPTYEDLRQGRKMYVLWRLRRT